LSSLTTGFVLVSSDAPKEISRVHPPATSTRFSETPSHVLSLEGCVTAGDLVVRSPSPPSEGPFWAAHTGPFQIGRPNDTSCGSNRCLWPTLAGIHVKDSYWVLAVRGLIR